MIRPTKVELKIILILGLNGPMRPCDMAKILRVTPGYMADKMRSMTSQSWWGIDAIEKLHGQHSYELTDRGLYWLRRGLPQVIEMLDIIERGHARPEPETWWAHNR